jgi:alkylated DNA nucleotide flippase Atl1
MVYKKKTWREKLHNNKSMPKILEFDPKFPCGKALAKRGAKPGDQVVLAPPLEVEEIMRSVPRGKLITLDEICEYLSKKHGTNFCCTLTTGIFVMIAANAAEEAREEGEEDITPYWRTLKVDGYLNEKYPGGANAQRAMLEEEGFTITKKGSRYRVENYQEHLV